MSDLKDFKVGLKPEIQSVVTNTTAAMVTRSQPEISIYGVELAATGENYFQREPPSHISEAVRLAGQRAS